MRKLIFAFIIALSLVLLIFSVSIKKPQKIFIPTQTINLGIIDSVDPIEVKFKIQNRGEQLLYIQKVQAACPCQDINLGNDVLSPYQETLLTFKIFPRSKAGRWIDKVLVISNDPVNPVVSLSVESYIKPSIIVLPNSIAIHDLKYGEHRVVEIEVINPSGDDSFQVINVTSNNGHISGNISGQVLKKQGLKIINIHITVQSRGLDAWDDKILIKTSSSIKPVLEIPITVRESSWIEINPKMLCFQESDKINTEIPAGEIVITSAEKELKVADVQGPNWLNIKVREDSKVDKLRFELYFNENLQADPGKNIIKILFAEMPPVEVPVWFFQDKKHN